MDTLDPSGVADGHTPSHGHYTKPKDKVEVPIIDIRRDRTSESMRDEILNGLRQENGMEKRLPTMLLYDEAGLRLFEQITYLDEYYLTNAEIEVLNTYADQIAQRIPDGSMVIELGSGNLRKVNILLRALDKLERHVEYYALDLDLAELERTFAQVRTRDYEFVKCHGLHGTYDDGLEWLQQPQNRDRPKTILWLGSSLGNFTRIEAESFLSAVAATLDTRDKILVGLDACKDPARVHRAYNDREGVTHRFILNGLRQANRLLGTEAFQLGHWKVLGEYDIGNGRHQAFVYPTQDVTIDGILIKTRERIRIEHSYKYSPNEARSLWQNAGVVEGTRWSNRAADYAIHMLSKPVFAFPSDPKVYASNPVPTLDDWKNLWASWDVVTQDMIPKEELLSKPIKLRNACIFYLGHIPAFLDIKLTHVLGGKPTEPATYHQIFERGIDPDVDNPEKCHAHSEIPNEWPALTELLAYQDRVRERVLGLYASGQAKDQSVGRCLWLGLEHEAMHLETLLYMLLQSEKTLPPPGTVQPDFEAMSKEAQSKAVPNEWINVPESTLQLGLDDPETSDGPDRFFGWDIEKPPKSVKVGAFTAKARPITNGEYVQYLQQEGIGTIPAGWLTKDTRNGDHPTNGLNELNDHVNGHHNDANGSLKTDSFVEDKYVKTVYGPVPLSYALDWPIMASYDELAGCAAWMGGRIPTVEEAESIYAYAEKIKERDAHKALGNAIPAVNAHLLNDGVEESPPSKPSSNGLASFNAGSDPTVLFTDLENCNVSFKHWHPVPVTDHGAELCGRAEMGGAWEWTSSELEKKEGYEPMKLYPAYSSDFFDGKHNIVLGGSWATIPRIAGRKSFVNWFQRNYPYAWVGARVVRDI
ncbi:MAG: hypothetical protein M1820_009202 [Bogoriella megaspora]|nr:MAG: hypothetical protein M1820_009202 [Bogoriella megaspora]